MLAISLAAACACAITQRLGMMGTPGRGVECSAKKAMTTLSGASAAMGLLPNSARPRRIFLRDRMAQIIDH
jgi:hypothetical protein